MQEIEIVARPRRPAGLASVAEQLPGRGRSDLLPLEGKTLEQLARPKSKMHFG